MSLNVEFISAGAGSGKTYTLTEKLKTFLNEGDIKPSGIIATTFTKMAAAELKERVRQSLVESGKRTLANQMGEASISTVNGVCGDLLKRFAFEANLSPDQQVLGEDEGLRLYGEAIDTVLGEDKERVSQLNRRAYRLGIEDWRADVMSISKSARANNIKPDHLVKFSASSSDGLLKHFRKPIKRDLDAELRQAITTAIDAIENNDDQTKTTASALDELKNSLRSLDRKNLIWSGWVKLFNLNGAKKSAAAIEPVNLVAEDFEAHPQLHEDIRQYISEVFSLAADSLEAYQELKKQQGLLDFVDQEQLLYELLEHPEVKLSLSEELELLMVDEFQDTSPIQLALFVRLAELAKKVIWVGDIKQAIYGFRGSDPALMQAVLQSITASGGSTQILENSWRSRAPLVEYCNAVFSKAFEDTLPKGQVILKPQRSEQSDQAAVMHWALHERNIQGRLSELASGILELIDNEYQVVDKNSGSLRQVEFGDIAILCRSNDRLKAVASSCADMSIPVSYERAGVLSTPECCLALACLRRLNDPSDTLATAEIRALALGEPAEEWLSERLEYLNEGGKSAFWGENDDDAIPLLAELAKARKSLSSLTPSETLSEAISRGDLRAVVNAWGPDLIRSRNRLANLDILIGMARDYEDSCEVRNVAATVSGLILWLNDMADAEMDAQAKVDDDKAVTLVTYHRSKGLEWPVVIAFDQDSSLKTRLWGLNVEANPDGFDVTDPLKGRQIRYWPYPFGKTQRGIAVKERIEESEAGLKAGISAAEEEKRLQYVTYTRARDLLIFPLSEKAKPVTKELLGCDWLYPTGDSLDLPGDISIPSASYSPVLAEKSATSEPYQPFWLPSVSEEPNLLPRKISPSGMPKSECFFLGEVVEIGDRIGLGHVNDMAAFGTALHNIIAAYINRGAEIESEILNMLSAYGEQDAITAQDALHAASRLKSYLESRYNVQNWFVEYPITHLNNLGQEATGFIDLLVETDEGWIIVDHKSSPEPRSKWAEIAERYSGQMNFYREVVESNSGKPVIGTWIHFPVTGGVVQCK